MLPAEGGHTFKPSDFGCDLKQAGAELSRVKPGNLSCVCNSYFLQIVDMSVIIIVTMKSEIWAD